MKVDHGVDEGTRYLTADQTTRRRSERTRKMTYRYEITKNEDEYRVTEADGPTAKATGTYATREAAEAAIEAVAGKPLDFEYGESEGIEYWTVEFEA